VSVAFVDLMDLCRQLRVGDAAGRLDQLEQRPADESEAVDLFVELEGDAVRRFFTCLRVPDAIQFRIELPDLRRLIGIPEKRVKQASYPYRSG